MCGINKYEFVHVWPTQYNGCVRKAQKSVIKMCVTNYSPSLQQSAFRGCPFGRSLCILSCVVAICSKASHHFSADLVEIFNSFVIVWSNKVSGTPQIFLLMSCLNVDGGGRRSTVSCWLVQVASVEALIRNLIFFRLPLLLVKTEELLQADE